MLLHTIGKISGTSNGDLDFDKLVMKQLSRKSLNFFETSINIDNIIERLHEK
jgi:hypothetical protein